MITLTQTFVHIRIDIRDNKTKTFLTIFARFWSYVIWVLFKFSCDFGSGWLINEKRTCYSMENENESHTFVHKTIFIVMVSQEVCQYFIRR